MGRIADGSQFILKLMERFPVIIVLGGMLLGWIAGTMAVTDPAVLPYVPTLPVPADKPQALPEVVAALRYSAGVGGALLVLAMGLWIRKRHAGAGQA